MNLNRTPAEILALFELTIDSCFEIAKADGNISDDEKAILDKLSEWKLKIEPQFMNMLEATMDETDFHDIVQQVLAPVIDSVFEQARKDGKITHEEQELLDNIVEKLKT